MSDLLVDAQHVSVQFRARRGQVVYAVDDVSIELRRGETYGLIGESGSGKSTFARAVLGIVPSTGSVTIDAEAAPSTSGRGRTRGAVAMVFQDPTASLDPRMTVGASVREPLDLWTDEPMAKRNRKVRDALERVGMRRAAADRYPHELSGGQKQRVNIARALLMEPQLLICDESVSALDVAVQAEILNLLGQLQRDLGLTMLFISHDLGVVAHIADRIGVMYLGRLVEEASAQQLLGAPHHPYTKALISAQPEIEARRRRQRILLTGEVPSALNPPSGCGFRTRCSHAMDRCSERRPEFAVVGTQHRVACVLSADATTQSSTSHQTSSKESHEEN